MFGKKKKEKHSNKSYRANAIKGMVEAGIMLDNWYMERKKKDLELKILESQMKDSKPKADYIEGLETGKA